MLGLESNTGPSPMKTRAMKVKKNETKSHEHQVRISSMTTNPQSLIASVFYHLGGVDVFHHDSPAFCVSGHLWVDAIDAHVTVQPV